MKKAALLFLSISFLGFANRIHAQFGMGKPEDIQQVKKRKLIVILEEPDDKLMKKLTKKGKNDLITEYQNAIDAYNKEMKEVVEKFWTFSSTDILYKTGEEVDKLKPSWSQYALVYCTTAPRIEDLGLGFKHTEGLLWSPQGEDKIESDGITEFVVCLPEKNRNIYYLTMPDIFPTKADLVYGISSTNYYFNYRLAHQKASRSEVEDMIADNQVRLKNRTLLLRQDNIDSKLTPQKIKDAYPFKYRTVSTDEMDQYVVNADSGYAYSIICPYIGGRNVVYVQYVYDCKDGSLLAMSMPSFGGMLLGAYTGVHSGHTVVTEKTLGDFCQYIVDKKKKK